MWSRDRWQLWTLMGMLLLREGTAHIRLTYPRARKYDFDFLDNVRTPGPCGGMPKDPKQSTNLQAGGQLQIEWHLSYPHRGGYYFQLMSDNNTKLYRYPASGTAGQTDGTSLTYEIPLPSEQCINCTLQMIRQAGEWTAGSGQDYLFWSCADVNILSTVSDPDKCTGHGSFRNGQCMCERLYTGDKCQFNDECADDGDCGGAARGQCVDTNSTSYPKKQCYCKPGWFGSGCQKVSHVTALPADLTSYQKVELRKDIALVLYYKILQDLNELEVIMSAKTVSWMSLGWRPSGTPASCQKFPSLTNVPSYGNPLGEPHSEGEPTAESKPEPKAEGTAEPKAEGTAEPKAEGTAKPKAEGTAEPRAEVTSNPAGTAAAEPVAEGTAKPAANNTAKPAAKPEPAPEVTAEPKAEVTAKPAAEPVAEGVAEPGSKNATKPGGSGTAEPVAEAKAEPNAEGKPTSVFRDCSSEPDGTSEPKSEPKSEPGSTSEPKSEPKSEPGSTSEPKSEPKSEPGSTSEPKSEPKSEPTSEGEPTGNGLHAMDCTDVVIAQAKGDLYRVGDFYTRDRSTPVMDEYLGGVNSLTAALAWEKDDTTTMIFRRKIITTDPADHEFKNELTHVIWAVGQRQGAYRHSPCSALETSEVSIADYYKKDELKYHGAGSLQRGTAAVNFFSQTGTSKPGNSDCLKGSCPASQCGLEASWDLDTEADTVQFTLRANVNNNPNAWIAVGFSEDGLMKNTDVVYGGMDSNGMYHVWDGYLTGYSKPNVAEQQDISQHAVRYESGYLTLTFKRKRVTGDKNDFNLASQACPYLIFGLGGDVIDSTGGIQKHVITPYVYPDRVCFKPCSGAASTYDLEGELRLQDKTFVPALRDNTSEEFRQLATTVRMKIETALRPSYGDRLQEVTILRMRPGSVVVDFLLQFNSTAPVDQVEQELKKGLNFSEYTLTLQASSAATSPAPGNHSPDEGLSEVEIIVIALAVALVVVAIIIAVCKIIEVKRSNTGYKRRMIREYSLSSGKAETPTMTYREFMTSSAENDSQRQPSNRQSAYVNHAYDASGYQKHVP